MPTSGTRNFGTRFTNSELVIEAFDRCEIRANALTRPQLISARRSVNLALNQWQLKGINLGKVISFTVQMAASQATITSGVLATQMPANLLTMLDVYWSQIDGGGTGVNIDRIMLPMSRTDYAELSNKLQPGLPTMYWFEKLASPVMTIYQPPYQAYPTYQLTAYAVQQFEDANLGGLETPDVVERGLDALCAELAYRLAKKFRPARAPDLKEDRNEAWALFASDDREDSPISILPAAQYWGRGGD